MSKEEFLSELRKKAGGLPKEDLNNLISFYGEMIDDKVREGKTEEEVVAEIGSVDDIVKKVAAETPLVKLVRENARNRPKKKLKTWQIVLLIVGFPVWFPIIAAGVVLGVTLFLLMWVLNLVSYLVELAIVIVMVVSFAAFIASAIDGDANIMYLGLSVACAGCALLFQYVCVGLGKGTVRFTRKTIHRSKEHIVRKGEEE
ncbi:MAG: DUF1700 domain-containing protein [Clostridia bacterium]|nr:DUF1700 domain-containing protein [Clostridia bacterium]